MLNLHRLYHFVFPFARIYFTDRCIEELYAPIKVGFYSGRTGHFVLFHADRTVSVYNTGGLGFQLLEHKPYSEYFICDDHPTNRSNDYALPTFGRRKVHFSWFYAAFWFAGGILLGIILVFCSDKFSNQQKASSANQSHSERIQKSEQNSSSSLTLNNSV